MKLMTKRFGEMEVDPEQTIRFSQGLPGFEQQTRFILLHPYPDVPFYFLQSTEEGDLSFILADPFQFFYDYTVDMPESVVKELDLQDERDAAIFSMVTVRSAEELTVNLLAPVIINVKDRCGKQIILHSSSYTTKHRIAIRDRSKQTAAKGEA